MLSVCDFFVILCFLYVIFFVISRRVYEKKSVICPSSYLTGRRQRVKVNGSFSSWKEMKLGVPQGSVLGPLLFNIFINDIALLLNETEICNYADDTTIYCSHMELQKVTLRLANDTVELSNWFAGNFMKLNEEKCHLLVFDEKDRNFNKCWPFCDQREQRRKIVRRCN